MPFDPVVRPFNAGSIVVVNDSASSPFVKPEDAPTIAYAGTWFVAYGPGLLRVADAPDRKP